MDFAGAHALLIGTGTHLPESDLPDIPAVARTLADLRSALLDRCGLGEVRVVLDPGTPLELGSAISEAASGARGPLIVYYVGHGLVSRRGGLHLAAGVTRSGPLHLEHTGLPYDTMRRYLLDNVDGPVAVVLDCCFSGRAIEGMAAYDEVASLAEITGAYVLTSAGRSEPSFAPEGMAHTAFSGALLRLLEEGIPDGPPFLTFHDIHRELSRTLPASGFPRPRARSTGRAGELRLAPNPGHRGSAGGARLSAAGQPEGSPYRGLAAFREADAALFFGREALVSTLVRELAERQADPAPLIVTGVSGSGKSSLLRAGLVPALAQGALGFPASAAVIVPGEPVPDVDVLIVDQVEEAALPEEVFSGDRLLVLGVRADFLGRLAEDPRLRFERGQVVVGPMTERELRDAIERPAAAAGLSLEPGLVELLLRDLGTEPGRRPVRGEPGRLPSHAEPGRLPLLSHALHVTWQQRDGTTLTVAGYRRTGGIAGALAATADDVLAGLPSPDEARTLFLRLVRVGEATDDTRLRVPADRLPVGREVIDAFAADGARLLTLDRDLVMITHEALLTAWPALRSWLDADRGGLLIEQHLVEAAEAWDGDPGGLYRGSRLALAREWAAGRSLGALADRFLAASVAAADRQARRRVAVTSVLAGLLVVSLVASLLAVLRYQDAERARRVAAGRALIFRPPPYG
ncbi:MAG: hypothetical protein HOY71_55930, partial [Nonomuraea sp.]|nr:hypothetical protein [Nonomuraea sp.]